nr:cytochrome c oxidase subunit 8A, mitochondrial [Pelodiscus sinensis]|eukprot:XP_025034530.1 cytochrome c oxidase subunit 8A, mitochondrial [Pelodiscus sinensis]
MAVFPMLCALLCPHLALPTLAVHSDPPENPMGLLESIIGLSSFFLAFLVLVGWILASLESYKRHD